MNYFGKPDREIASIKYRKFNVRMENQEGFLVD